MAKRKNSVALFEVITATKKKEAAASAAPATPKSLRTPKWWFKSKSKDGATTDHAVRAEYAAPALPPAQAPAEFAPEAPAAYQPPSAVVQRVVPAGYVSPAPERVSIPERSTGTEAFGLDGPARTNPARRAMDLFGFGAKMLGLDRERREVTLRFRYTTAITVGFALCVVFGLAYVSGRQANRATAGPNAMSSEAVRRGQVLHGVLDLKQDRVVTSADGELANDTDHIELPEPKRAGPAVTPSAPTSRVTKLPPRKNVGDVEIGLPRVVGLNYVIMQTYPERKDAEEARAALDAAGIPCTVETSPKNWATNPTWVSVIGIHGFPRPNSQPEYQNYRDSIDAVSKAFAGKSKLKKFDPMPYKWKQ